MSYNLNDDGGEPVDQYQEWKDQQTMDESQYEADAGKRADEYINALREFRESLITLANGCHAGIRRIDELQSKWES